MLLDFHDIFLKITTKLLHAGAFLNFLTLLREGDLVNTILFTLVAFVCIVFLGVAIGLAERIKNKVSKQSRKRPVRRVATSKKSDHSDC